MARRRHLLLLGGVYATTAFRNALAADPMTLLGAGAKPSAAPSYTGPGDIVASAAGWWGLQGYSAAVAATGTQKAVTVRRASDNATQDIVILTTGLLDVASVNSFAGTDATGNATSAGTSVALTGLSGAAHVGDVITGAGFAGTYCVSVGALVAGAQTVTTNTSQSIGVSEPVTLTWGLYATKIWDQSGNSYDAAQATAANQAQLLTAASDGLPSLVGSLSAGTKYSYGGVAGFNQPMTYSSVSKRTGSFTSVNTLMSSGATISFGFKTTPDFFADAGVQISQAETDSSFHANQMVYNNSAPSVGASVFYTDGAASSPAFAGLNNAVTGMDLLQITGEYRETGRWSGAFNSTQAGNMNSNQHSRWAF